MGLKLGTKKTKLMRSNIRNINETAIKRQEIEDVDGFDYLGAKLTKHRGSGDNIKAA